MGGRSMAISAIVFVSVAFGPSGPSALPGVTRAAPGSTTGQNLQGSAGTLDTAFGDGGIVLTNVGETADAASVLVMDDGLAVAFDGTPDDGVVKYRVDGSLDASFDDDGILLLERTDDWAPMTLMAGPRDTLLVLHGSFLERRLPDGTLDTSFGSGGRVDVRPGTYVRGDRRADGRILLVGGTKRGDLAIRRFTPRGLPDGSFGTGGRVVVDLGSWNDRGVGIAALPNGKTLAAGSLVFCRPDCLYDYGSLVRLNVNGSVDRTFGTDGLSTWPTGHGSTLPAGMGTTARGDIVVFVNDTGGVLICPAGVASGYAVRFHGDGTRDRGFGRHGRVPVPFIQAVSFALQPDGQMLFAGMHFRACEESNLAMVRLSDDGSLDPTFGEGGLASALIEGRDSAATALSVQTDGRIVLAGSQDSWEEDRPEEPLPLIVARFLGS